MKKVWLVIGSNNFWYAECESLEDAKETAEQIKAGEGGYEVEKPERVYIYEGQEVARIEIEEEK